MEIYVASYKSIFANLPTTKVFKSSTRLNKWKLGN